MIESYITHYFEKEYGPFLSICDLDSETRDRIIQSEQGVPRGFNRFDYGREFFDFRELADDLMGDLYQRRFGKVPACRPYFGVLGEADVVGGLYREPCKISIPISSFEDGELTFMCPDHFHLVSYNRIEVDRKFGFQLPDDYSKEKYAYYGQLFSVGDLNRDFDQFGLGSYLKKQRAINHWYRYIEAQIWVDRTALLERGFEWQEVVPESWIV